MLIVGYSAFTKEKTSTEREGAEGGSKVQRKRTEFRPAGEQVKLDRNVISYISHLKKAFFLRSILKIGNRLMTKKKYFYQ